MADFVAAITAHLKQGDRIRMSGLGILEVKARPARTGRNPGTGETIQIKASKKGVSSSQGTQGGNLGDSRISPRCIRRDGLPGSALSRPDPENRWPAGIASQLIPQRAISPVMGNGGRP